MYVNATTSSEGRRSIVVVLLAVSVFVLICSVSCRQVTAPGSARNLLEAGIVTLTDIDQLIADDAPALRQAVQDSPDQEFTIPGYPLDVLLTRNEILQSNDQQLRTLVLERSSALLYAEGLESFDRTGNRSVRRLSLQGLLELEIGQVSKANYDRATLLSLIAVAGCALFGAIAAANGEGWGRMRAIGMAAAAGALPVILVFFLVRLTAGAIGGGDPFEASFRDITKSVLAVPIRNGIIVLAAGVAVVAGSVILGQLERAISGSSRNLPEDSDY